MAAMKKHLMAAIVILSAALQAATHAYDIKMRLKVPRVYANSYSLGYRKMQSQTLSGTLILTDSDSGGEPYAYLSLYNRTHLLSTGANVVYTCYPDSVRWHLIGDNARNRFTKASVFLSVICDPSYNIGDVEEDNTLVLYMSGHGKESRISGTVSGLLGCGCSEYGHVSPTRVMWSCEVTDTAAVEGRWTAKLRK